MSNPFMVGQKIRVRKNSLATISGEFTIEAFVDPERVFLVGVHRINGRGARARFHISHFEPVEVEEEIDPRFFDETPEIAAIRAAFIEAQQ